MASSSTAPAPAKADSAAAPLSSSSSSSQSVLPFMTSSTTTSPVIAGHRGFKSQYTENTLLGFGKCFESGATVIETDLWLSSDNVIVISHDISTKRVFVDQDGNETDYKITKTPFDPILKNLKTKEGGYPLLSFVDVLQWFKKYVDATGSNEHKLQLDIKKFNPAKITKYLINDLLKVHNDISWWYHRIQFGLWDLSFLKFLNQNESFQDKFGIVNEFGCSQFDIFHISVNWRDSINYINYNYYLDETTPQDRIKIKLTGVSLLYIATWSTEFLTKFVPLLQIQNLKLYSWTINNKFQFEYLVKVGRLAKLVEYGVISDHPDVMVKYKKHEDSDSDTDVEVVNSNEAETKQQQQQKPLVTYESKNFYYNEDGELNIGLTWNQKLLSWGFEKLMSLNGSQRKITSNAQRFGAQIDENHVDEVKPNGIIVYIFQKCQKYGIF
ncbi:hypothetical protein CANMA_002598 [Candida margitis]|uniref:uncharacterized protein n=1 Tax=Candida margitis TaxID=1775924 RepID=UPI00222675F2|nr:uncharacterized protein CANMA_002598 [Candida margitis]KAI5968096.1 hypothetical protein CANMA_002598 [Candida margitis]